VGGGVESRSTRHCGHLMAYRVSPGWLWWWRNRWNDWQGKPKYSGENLPIAVLSTTNPTCCPYANPGRRWGKPAELRHGHYINLLCEVRSTSLVKHFDKWTELLYKLILRSCDSRALYCFSSCEKGLIPLDICECIFPSYFVPNLLRTQTKVLLPILQ
jgi:hypothetical protein